MCGICGIMNFNGKPVSHELLESMKDKLRHRGPDDEGEYFDGPLGLGHLRLSIIDLTDAGHQPMSTDDGRYQMIFNGEIYNYLELREELQAKGVVFHTDTDGEVLLQAYVNWGIECLDKLNGMFAFVIYDRRDKSLFCVRDRYGIKPFYYSQSRDYFAFASEIPSLLCALSGKPVADDLSIFEYFVFNRSDQSERTFFQDVKKLQHGHYILIKDGKVEIRRWYNLKDKISPLELTGDDWLELFEASLKMRLRADVPIGVCLSGGLDSSAIVATLVKKFGLNEMHTFSAVYGANVIGDESPFIDTMRPMLTNMHFITPDSQTLYDDMEQFVAAQGEPVQTTSPYAQFKVMEKARENVVVTLDGQGADESLAGYHYFFGSYFKDLLRHWNLPTLSREMMSYMTTHRSVLGLKTLIYFLLPQKSQISAQIRRKPYLNSGFVERNRVASTIAGDLYGGETLGEALINHFEFKLEHLLKWEDRNSMHYSLEARVPFLDHRLVEATLGLSADRIINKGTTKIILRESMNGILPEKIRQRRDKIGFMTPGAVWFRQDVFKKFVPELLNSSSFKSRGYIDADGCLARFNAHQEGKVDLDKDIWKWINLELWHREFIDV